MNTFTLSFVARAIHASFNGQDSMIREVQTDSRQLTRGDLFVALPGERVDGHEYIKEAEAKQAAAVIVSQPVDTTLPTLLVPDTLKALGELAKYYRQPFQIPMIAVTGSCGKTTVKEMIANILGVRCSVLATKGNLNTEVGVPLTLLRLSPVHECAVIEMGARKKGDIAYLMSIASPTISLITNAGVAHMEIFGSENGIAEAKGEIFSCLNETGTAIINADDKHARYWRGLLKQKQSLITFGIHNKADVVAKDIHLDSSSVRFELVTDSGSITIHLNVAGEHMVQNALAAAAAALSVGMNLSEIQLGLRRFEPANGRLQFKTGIRGVRIIDDTYNANPVSVRAALLVLAQYPDQKIFVMGDMFELGEESLRLHRELGEEAKRLGIQQFFGIGQLTQAAVEGFGPGAVHFNDKESLVKALREQVSAETAVLIKGSRGMRMEEVVLPLVEA